MSLRHGLTAIVRVIRRRVQQQAQDQIHGPRQAPDGVQVRPAGQSRAAHAEAIARSSRNPGVLHQNSTNFASRASRIWAMTPRARIPQANGSKILPQSRPVLPILLGFAGVGFVNREENAGGVVDDENGSDRSLPLVDLDTAVHLVRSVFKDHEAKAEIPNTTDYPKEIEDYAISESVLAKGTEGVVYAAKKKDVMTTSDDTSAPLSNDEVSSSEIMRGEMEEFRREEKTTEMSICDEKECNLAVKMMFNYNVGSTLDDIVTDFQAEQLPLLLAKGQFGHPMSKERASASLQSRHPNVVEMYQTFVDYVRVPSLHSAVAMFDMALPKRLNCDGLGADTTFYIVMKRYKMSLREYLGSVGPLPDRSTTLIIAQLLEAVAYLGNQGIVHRDLKTNNILVQDLADGFPPHIVLADFGCAVSLRGKNLTERVTNDDIAGNTALMAPEVKKGIRNRNIRYHDYLKSDAWAVGAIAYEVCGQRNPFYSPPGLNSETYHEENLPQLQTQAVGLKIVVDRLLQRDPNDRPSATVAADILHKFLWQPSVAGFVRLCSGQSSHDRELVAWLMKVSLTYLLCDRENSDALIVDGQGIPQTSTERELLRSFLSRVNAASLKQASHITIAELSRVLVPTQTSERNHHCKGSGQCIEEQPHTLACQV